MRSKWIYLFLAAIAVLFGQRAAASYTPLSDVRASITQPQQITATAAELQADEWLVESITPLGLTADGQPLALITLLVPTTSLDEFTPASTRAGPYAAPKTHTRVFCIGQPPLGLDYLSTDKGRAYWVVEGDGWKLPILIGKHRVSNFNSSRGSVGTGLDVFLQNPPDESVKLMGMFGGKTMNKTILASMIRKYDRQSSAYNNAPLAPSGAEYRLEAIAAFFDAPGTRTTSTAVDAMWGASEGAVASLDMLPFTPDWAYVYADENGIVPKYLLASRLFARMSIFVYGMKINREISEGIFNRVQLDYKYADLPFFTKVGVSMALPGAVLDAVLGPIAGSVLGHAQKADKLSDYFETGRDVFYLFSKEPFYANPPEDDGK